MAKILIVEDEGLLAITTEMYLNEMGHEVAGIADNGKQAIELALSSKPDIILMDIVIQGSLSGIETAKLIQERYACKIIYLTAHTDSGTVQLARKSSHAGFLVKPFESAQLSEIIDTVLGVVK